MPKQYTCVKKYVS